jgi:hypothetical protein
VNDPFNIAFAIVAIVVFAIMVFVFVNLGESVMRLQRDRLNYEKLRVTRPPITSAELDEYIAERREQ